MRRITRASRLTALLPLAWLACSAAPLPPAKTQEAAREPEKAAYVTPPRWAIHPATPLSSTAALKLPDGKCLFTAEGGQRWVSAIAKVHGSRVVCAGEAEPSPALAAEELVAITRRANGAWLFVADDGTLYEAAEPLGPFVRRIAASEPLVKVASAGAALVATTWSGKLLRWEEGKGWAPSPSSPVLDRSRVFDVASGSGGRLLALAFPEALLASEDLGSTWSAVAAPTIGARRLGNTSAGDLGAQGIVDSVAWRGPAFVRSADRLVEPRATLAIEVGRSPSTSAVQQGHASLEDDRYDEVVRPDTSEEPWVLSRGRFDGRLESIPIPDTGRCTNVRVGARGEVVVIVCGAANDMAEVRRSDDGGATWSESLRLPTPDIEAVLVAVSRSGDALVTGVCRGAASAPCVPSTPVRVLASDAPPDGGTSGSMNRKLRALAASAPQLASSATAPTFSFDGRSAYFVGTRAKEEKPSVFVSHDGGITFAPRRLAESARPRRENDDESPGEEGSDGLEIEETTALRAAEDGTIGFVAFRPRSSLVYVTTDEDLRILQVSTPILDAEGNPLADVVYAGVGRRVLALWAAVSGSGLVGGASVWESSDGGASWTAQPTPVALTRDFGHAGLLSWCSVAGCLLGDTVTRVGWGAGPEEAEVPPSPPAPTHERRVLTPLVCDVPSSSRWTRIADGVPPPERASPIPSTHELMRGRSAWSVLTAEPKTGIVTVVDAELTANGDARATRHPLLGPRGKNVATAFALDQAEGFVVVRATYPTERPTGGNEKRSDKRTDKRKDEPIHLAWGRSLQNVEIAWHNVTDGASGRARPADAGRLDSADVNLWTRDSGALAPALLALRGHAVFARLHAKAKDADEIVVDPSGRVSQSHPPALPTAGPLGKVDVSPDGAWVGGEPLLVGLVPEERARAGTVLVAKRTGGPGWTFNADALLPTANGSRALTMVATWSVSPASPGFVALVANDERQDAWAHYLPVRADATFGAPEPMPTLYDLPAKPRPCTDAERSRSPRVEMPFRDHASVVFPGTRHPVIVIEPRATGRGGPSDPIVLLTTGAVLHGTPSSPCVAAFAAESAQSFNASAVIGGDPGRSWLFRAALDGPSESGPRPDGVYVRAIEYRPMTCHYDPSAPVPDVVWSREGTSR